MCKVSVIIPAYNQAHYLDKAIQSVLDQSYADFEVIVVDDGSTDNTSEVAQQFSDPRVRYIHQQNRGLSGARNTGMRHATGEFVTFLDSDDLFLPEKLALLASELQANPDLGFVSGAAIMIDGDGRLLDKKVADGLPDEANELVLGNPVHVGSVMVRRSWLEQVEPFDESLRACEDWDMWLRLSRAGCRMQSVAQPVSLYRVHADQMTREAQRMRTAMLTVLDKSFAATAVPAGWQALRDKAYAAAYLKAAARAYHASDFASARQDLAEAVRLDPELLHDNGAAIANQLAGWAEAPMIENPLAYLQAAYANLPPALFPLAQQRHKYLGEMAVRLAFLSFRRGNMARTRPFIRSAIRYQPRLLANMGVWSLLLRSHLNLPKGK